MKRNIKIKNRYSDAVLWSGKVEAPTDTAASKLLGLAVLAAIKSRVNLCVADLFHVNLDGADLGGANLGGASLEGADLDGANLRGANLGGAILFHVNLDGADLGGAYLDGADLGGAYLRGANLEGADLFRVNLDGANLGGLKLIARASRADYEFMLWSSVLGGHIIRAGCNTMTIPEYRQHVAAEYPGTAKAEETLAILDYFEGRLNKFFEV
jgi:hypothetical protein